MSHPIEHRQFPSVRDVRERSPLEVAVDRLRGSYKWRRARTRRAAVDGYRCTYVDERGRCEHVGALHAHHLDRLTLLWDQAGHDYLRFETLACNVERLRSVCARHHPEVESEAKRREEGERHGT
jgi:hypothetical protein